MKLKGDVLTILHCHEEGCLAEKQFSQQKARNKALAKDSLADWLQLWDSPYSTLK